jgi:hypothetical protein
MTEPLTPAECDLRGLPFMPLDVVRLIESDLWALATGDEAKAALTLWARSWLQVPAASLPMDDRILAHLSGAGSRWNRVKAVALRGWVRCSDGRLYHPVVAEKAREAWAFRLRQRARSARGVEARWGSGASAGDLRPSHGHAAGDACGDARGDARGHAGGNAKGQGQRECPESSLRSDSGPAALPPSAAPLLHDVRTALWTEGLMRLRRLTGKPDRPARALLGRWLKAAGDDCALVAAVLVQAEMDRPGMPEAWIAAAIETRMGRGGGASGARRHARGDNSWEPIFGGGGEVVDAGVVDVDWEEV